MSLLDDEDEPFVEPVLRSMTREPLYDERADSTGPDGDDLPFRGKEKKDKKKLEDRRSSAKALPWSKSSTDKTPKKSRHGRTKSGSPPPVSPKGRGQEARKQTKGSSQMHPSPNVKSQRKRYVQLGVEAGSSSEGEVDLEAEEGFLVTNQPAVREQNDVFGSMATTEGPKLTKETSFFEQETSESQADAWWPQPLHTRSPPRQSATGSSLDQRDAFLPHTARSAVQATASPLLGELFPSQQPSNQPSTFGLPTNIGPSSLPLASSEGAPSQPWPPQDNTSEPDWTISDDLKQKCIQQFNDLRPTEGLLQGGKARQFFVQSKLPNQELSAIWRLADTDRDNALSEAEFCIAMKLVLMRRKGFVIPRMLPDTLQPKQHSAETTVGASESGGGTERSSASEPTPEVSTVGHVTPEEPILVDIGNGDSDTGLLVDVDEVPTESPPPKEPPVARIISIDQPWSGDEDQEDTALVSTQQPKPSEDPSSPSRQPKPTRPAPPKPALRRAKTVKERPSLPPRPSERSLSPPPGGSVEAQSLIIIDSRQKSKSVRVSGRSPGTSRKEYSILGESSGQEAEGQEEGGANHVRWKSSAVYEDKKPNGGKERDKGHARSTSLDLNKMLLADGNSEELEGVPSAEPPKPPPKPSQRTLNNGGEQDGFSPIGEDGADLLAPRGRVRALSTGSIVQDDPLPMEAPTDMLLFSSKPAPMPKPRRKAPVVPPNKPQRPPPPSKSTATELLHTKDKVEIQAHIRSLKENNSALTEINGHLEDKLFKLIEERVRLAKQLKQLQQLQQQEQEQNHQQ